MQASIVVHGLRYSAACGISPHQGLNAGFLHYQADSYSLVPPGGILQARILEWIAMPSSRGSSHPGIEPRSPALQVDSLPAELPGKPLGK